MSPIRKNFRWAKPRPFNIQRVLPACSISVWQSSLPVSFKHERAIIFPLIFIISNTFVQYISFFCFILHVETIVVWPVKKKKKKKVAVAMTDVKTVPPCGDCELLHPAQEKVLKQCILQTRGDYVYNIHVFSGVTRSYLFIILALAI